MTMCNKSEEEPVEIQQSRFQAPRHRKPIIRENRLESDALGRLGGENVHKMLGFEGRSAAIWFFRIQQSSDGPFQMDPESITDLC
jgi:hypothetical protein